MSRFRLSLVSIIYAIQSVLMVSCKEEPEVIIWSDEVSADYFLRRGFNLRFKEIRVYRDGDEFGEINDANLVETMSNVTLNVGDVLLVNSGDVITFANDKFLPGAIVLDLYTFPEYTYLNGTLDRMSTYHPVFINCKRMPMNVGMSMNMVTRKLPAAPREIATHEYKGRFFIRCEFWQDLTHVPGGWITNELLLFRFDLSDGLMMAEPAAIYKVDALPYNTVVTLPATEDAVAEIVDRGVEGIDYALFSEDNITYVRIGHNLYQNRYGRWIFVGVTDVPSTNKIPVFYRPIIVFEVIDWDDIVAPYESHYYDRKYSGISGGDVIDSKMDNRFFDFGDRNNENDITTPMPCTR